tara:strand:+ start:3863 stop:4816 length:954 start_codon:yes stop_codon:yes gene_type:complete
VKKKSTKKETHPLPVCTRLKRNVFEVSCEIRSTKDHQWFLLRSDVHHDSTHCNRTLEKKHLEEVIERNALVFDFGDCYDVMQGRFDRRSSKDDLREEYKQGDYLDALVSDFTKYYTPYAKHFGMVSMGNHETAILKHHETNLTERLVDRLNVKTGSNIHVGGYSGWIRFNVKYGATEVGRSKDGYKRKGHETGGINLWYHHGYGGDAPVTKGTIQTARQAVYLPDAHVCVTGHTHNEFIMPLQRVRFKPATGTIYQDEQLHVKCAGYKEEYEDGFAGWHIERGAPPKPNGAMWLKIGWNKTDDVTTRGITYDVVRAK